MQQNLNLDSYRHRRIENGLEHTPSYVHRHIQINRSQDYKDLIIGIIPTLSPKRARLIQETDLFSQKTIHQDISTANILKYIGTDPDYRFYIRNKDSFRLHLSPFIPNFHSSIEIAFAEDDNLIVVLERRDKNLIIEYYK